MKAQQPKELGGVSWLRDLDVATEISKKSKKPILLFFQEIPGCSTCVNYGKDVLSHPLMVEVIENEFVPVLIHNNRSGYDEKVLKMFNEPPWNNPVSYFLNEKLESIIPKLENNYSPFSLYAKITNTLQSLKKEVPLYFHLLKKDLAIQYKQTITAMYETPCFWSGETTFAQHKAVYSTLPGFVGSKEVVQIEFDSIATTKSELDAFAKQQGFFVMPDNLKIRVDKDPQYYLKKTNYKYLPLSLSQKSLINLAIPYKTDPKIYLSPKQLFWFNKKCLPELSHPQAYTLPIAQAWEFLENISF
jgi:hypothetical protein